MNQWKIWLQDRPYQTFQLQEGQTLVIGRGAEADVCIDNPAVSRRHASLQMLNGACFVSDFGSTNGTLVNGRKIETATPVDAGDVVQIGKFQFRPEDPAAQDLNATVYVAPAPSPKKMPDHRPPRLTVVRGAASPGGCSTEGRPAIRIGKGGDCDLRISGWFVATLQCEVVLRDDQHDVVPRARLRATTLNGRKLTRATRLTRGDVIGAGPVLLKYE